ncbi:DNA glycosylase [Punctularia strigosozonata HHB-11173 SS5]|uniref:DNA glycosylase n=1 Tax=Punctularia strigosozonata (strain HHB-11173) TaxID=741275 RepID=UPI00044177D6|nr:DNA glycosylase [Punctularia strigosozonata HHB-11173 SS5]EIN12006.1 DNA glycosylase [Punctularia strigosozonata HHB-11173 SS5]
MPTTRSAQRAEDAVHAQSLVRFNSTLEEVTQTSSTRSRTTKRKADGSPVKGTPKRSRAGNEDAAASPKSILKPSPSPGPTAQRASLEPEGELVPAVLTFSFEGAKRHLISVDGRFADVFAKMKCRPFQNLERVDPFRTLTQSILGQQISWKAARSITYKFIRLFHMSLPEARPDGPESVFQQFPFPTAHQVATIDIPALRSAGLSGRKAEYVQDLAQRFADGRLSTKKLLEADDEELARMLLEVRGIGRVLDMFAMFSLRRPDILPVGDLGVQRGMLRWFLSLHSPSHRFAIAADKLPKPPGDEQQQQQDSAPKATPGSKRKRPRKPAEGDGDATVEQAAANEELSVPRGSSPDGDATDPAQELRLPALPTPFTPSIETTLNAGGGDELPGAGKKTKPAPLPEGLSVAVLKSRLDGKKKVKGAFLTPKEMEDLTESWKPYRSLGVYYMWALAEEPSSE